MQTATSTVEIPQAAEDVLSEVVAETWRTVEADDEASARDVAADVVRRLTTVYNL